MGQSNHTISSVLRLTVVAALVAIGVKVQAEDSPLPPPPVEAATQPAPAVQESTNASATAPTGTAPVKAGPFVLTPSDVVVRLSYYTEKKVTCFDATVKFQILNTSAAAVRVSLFKQSLIVTDSLGIELFSQSKEYVSVGGVTGFSSAYVEYFVKFLNGSKDQLTVISPRQSVAVQLRPDENGRNCVQDPEQNIKKTHRPKTINLAGTIGIVDLAGAAELLGFSFEDVPVTVISN